MAAKETDGLTPMMRQYRRTKEELDADTILFFRMGDFYEMFFEDAHRAAAILGIATTKRAGVPMCGVPYHALDGYLAKVIRAGLKAAVCEQVEDPKTTKGIVRREITRIVTPGTVTEEAILDAQRANYLAAIFAGKKEAYGIAALELSTGELAVEEASSAATLIEALRRIAPSETLLSNEQHAALSPLFSQEITGAITTTEAWRFMTDQAVDELCHHFHVHSLEGYCGTSLTPLWANAAGALLHYVRHELRHPVNHVQSLHVRNNGAFLTLDECTCRNLDLLPTAGGRSEPETLLGVLDGTCTPMGKRLLRAWIRSPLRDVQAIEARQDAIQTFIDQRRLLSDLRVTLSATHDFERVMTRLSSGSGNGRDLRQLCDSLAQIPTLRTHLNNLTAPLLTTLRDSLTELPELTHELLDALVEAPPLTLKEGGIIRPGYNAELDEYRQAATQGRDWIANYQIQQQEATGIRTLRVRHNNVFGFYIEVSKGQLANVPESYERRQTVVNAERFITPELKELETRILGAEEKSLALEQRLFAVLRDMATARTADIQRAADALAGIDAIASFAECARRRNYVRPLIFDDDRLVITNGRHPVLDAALGMG
jgi:DNA mismatch repair protein MutS